MEQDKLEQFLQAEFATHSFTENIAILACIAGHQAPETRLKRAVLWQENEPEFMVAPGFEKYIDCQLVDVLLNGEEERIVRDWLLVQVLKFFAPLPPQPNHTLVEFVRRGEFKIEELERA